MTALVEGVLIDAAAIKLLGVGKHPKQELLERALVLLARLDVRAKEVLTELLESGAVTYAQIAEAGAACRARGDAERKANAEQHEREWQAKQAAEAAAVKASAQ